MGEGDNFKRKEFFSEESATERKSTSEEEIKKESDFSEQVDFYAQKERSVERSVEQSSEKYQPNSSVSDNGVTDDDDEEEVSAGSIDQYAKEIVQLDADDQIDRLVQVAITKSPYVAIEVAKHLNDNYVLAGLHSDLNEDRIRDILVRKGFV